MRYLLKCYIYKFVLKWRKKGTKYFLLAYGNISEIVKCKSILIFPWKIIEKFQALVFLLRLYNLKSFDIQHFSYK